MMVPRVLRPTSLTEVLKDVGAGLKFVLSALSYVSRLYPCRVVFFKVSHVSAVSNYNISWKGL